MKLLLLPMMFPLILLICLFYVGKAIDCGGNRIANTIVVNQRGQGAFQTIQAAIDSIKRQNNQWILLQINPGIYKEKVHIPIEKPCIILKGSGSKTTIIAYNDSANNVGTSDSATFISSPPNVIVSGISFKNTHGPNGPAVAANFYGDKSAIFECSFFGYQDTLLLSSGRSYFKNCFIQGEVDFIFGSGQSYFENCVINAVQGKSRPIGFVTAQLREKPNDPNGFVFKGGSIIGIGRVNLGRPWAPYSRVIFLETYFSSVVTPGGWDLWHVRRDQEQNIVFAEVNCKGPGANTKNRVNWEKKPNEINLNEYTLSSFINNDGWLANIPSI
ncbi:putative pectinesterase 10 [Trifolium pratense]|uniref:Uncharacterized protein n=1 Tax=Trifolium pratense TaxID=57577 RepID=A0ACB0K7J6_TRIPR|nr:putative pectinesterase 10 [Trifolium pratense]CAJ2652298.1 unnamed protein product [Trifolium pratense]